MTRKGCPGGNIKHNINKDQHKNSGNNKEKKLGTFHNLYLHIMPKLNEMGIVQHYILRTM